MISNKSLRKMNINEYVKNMGKLQGALTVIYQPRFFIVSSTALFDNHLFILK